VVTDQFTRLIGSVLGASEAWFDRTHPEHGVSTVQYAFLMALIALVVALLVGLLGPGIKGLFGSGHGCLNGLTTTTCRVGQMTRVPAR
jgi:Flp pilus assembly pilin Flp